MTKIVSIKPYFSSMKSKIKDRVTVVLDMSFEEFSKIKKQIECGHLRNRRKEDKEQE